MYLNTDSNIFKFWIIRFIIDGYDYEIYVELENFLIIYFKINHESIVKNIIFY